MKWLTAQGAYDLTGKMIRKQAITAESVCSGSDRRKSVKPAHRRSI